MNMKSKVLSGCRFHIVRLFHFNTVKSNRPSSLIDSIIRVDHAGELGADRIYAGQMAILGNSKMGPVIQHMWDQEKIHRETFEKLIFKHRVRPTLLVPVWNLAGYILGAGTALMGEKAAMACTVAIESVIVEHYNDQLRELMAEPEKNKELMETIQKFRDEEQEHHDSGIDHGAEQAPFYKSLTEVIKLGCRSAIAISKGIYPKIMGVNYMSFRSYCMATQTKNSWDLYSAVCLERKPVISKDFNSLEKKFMQLLSDLEYENSFKSDHEMRKEEDIKRIEALKSNEKLDALELENLTNQTAQEFEDACLAEYKSFLLAPRITVDDEKNEVKSLNRQLEHHLLLLISEKIGNKNYWILPQGMLKTGENMREAAERILREKCGELLKVIFMGNAPCGFYKYRYPKSLKLKNLGAKVFFFKAIYISGEVKSIENRLFDYKWVTRTELENLVLPKKYLKNIQMFLISDKDYLDEKLIKPGT